MSGANFIRVFVMGLFVGIFAGIIIMGNVMNANFKDRINSNDLYIITNVSYNNGVVSTNLDFNYKSNLKISNK